MSYKNLGKAVRAAREKLDITRDQAAKRVRLSPNYLGMIERSAPTYVSEKVANKLISKLGAPKSIIRLLDVQNKAAAKESAIWRAKAAKKSKKAA